MDSSEKVKRINFLKGISDFFENQTDQNGKIFCPKDRIEHTGKNAYSIIINSKLFQLTNNDCYFKRAERIALRVVNNFIDDPDYGYGIFYPGRLEPRNAVNTVIDGGGCVDSLVNFLLFFEKSLDNEQKNKIKHSIYRHCEEYLTIAVKEKPVPNQRLWGGTGLAAGYQVFKNKEWKKALLESINISLREQNSDGSFPYFPEKRRDQKMHSGITDITAYYHSRHLAFIIDILEKIGEGNLFKKEIKKGADFLLGMYQPSGIKNISLEGKRWYWESNYEVASHSFDIYLLTKMFSRTKEKIYQYYAAKSFQKLLEHQIKDGGIVSHFGQGHNWQCRVVWNANLAWIAKIIEEIPVLIKHDRIKFIRLFDKAGLFKWENENYCALIRYKKKPMNIDFGSSIGGGSLIYFGQKFNQWKNQIIWQKWSSSSENNFIVKPKQNCLIKNLIDFIRQNKKEFRGQRWRFYVEFTGEHPFFALKKVFYEIFIKLFHQLKNEFSTQWSIETDLKREQKNNQISLVFHGKLAKRDGTNLENCFFSRKYRFGDKNFYLEEHLESNQPLKSLRYYKNKNFKYQSISNKNFIEKEKYIKFI